MSKFEVNFIFSSFSSKFARNFKFLTIRNKSRKRIKSFAALVYFIYRFASYFNKYSCSSLISCLISLESSAQIFGISSALAPQWAFSLRLGKCSCRYECQVHRRNSRRCCRCDRGFCWDIFQCWYEQFRQIFVSSRCRRKIAAQKMRGLFFVSDAYFGDLFIVPAMLE